MGDRVKVLIEIEVERVGQVAQSSTAVGVAIARALFGKTPGGRLVWAAGRTKTETAYRVLSCAMPALGLAVDAPTDAGDVPVRHLPTAVTAGGGDDAAA